MATKHGEFGDPCKTCGDPSSHLVNGKPTCCSCYVSEGNPPADWHTGCMEAAGRVDIQPPPSLAGSQPRLPANRVGTLQILPANLVSVFQGQE